MIKMMSILNIYHSDEKESNIIIDYHKYYLI